jgi:hypothetical protein
LNGSFGLLDLTALETTTDNGNFKINVKILLNFSIHLFFNVFKLLTNRRDFDF